MLHRGDAHGYTWIVSYQGQESRGPQRRVYRLTEQGNRHSGTWIEDLRRAKREIDLLVQAYERDVKRL